MTAVYFKATRPDGLDFYSQSVLYEVGAVVQVSSSARKRDPECCTDTVVHASTVPTETLIGGSWPCRLFEVTGRPVAEDGHKRGFRELTVLREVDAHLALGPQGREVAALIERARKIDSEEAERLVADRVAARDADRVAARDAAQDAAQVADRVAARDAAQVAAWDAAQVAAQDAAQDAAWDAARVAAWAAAREAAWALVVRDLIGQHGFTQNHYDLITRPWATTIGKVHPDDMERLS